MSEAVSTALQAYADRGVFRAFRATAVGAGRTEYQFYWLFRPPMRAVFNARRRVLTFPELFPAIAKSPMAAMLDEIVRNRSTPRVPTHKRLDGRRARVSSIRRDGALTLNVTIHGDNAVYAVQRTLNLVNDLFLALQEQYPDYLIERFGLSSE